MPGLEPDSPSIWICPLNPPETLRREANDRAGLLATVLKTKPTTAMVKQWLAGLGTVVAGQMPAAEAQQRITAYAALLDYPASLYTAETFRAAAKRFKWFPSFAEVDEFFTGLKAELLREKFRCEQIVKRGSRAVDDRGPITAAEREKVTAGFRQLKEALADPNKAAELWKGRGA